MFHTQLTQLAYEGLFLILLLSGPPIFISMFFGIGVAIFQAATQIQEQTLSFTVKLVAVILTLMFLGGWLGSEIMHFGLNIFNNFFRWVTH
jgi:type III secretion protein S